MMSHFGSALGRPTLGTFKDLSSVSVLEMRSKWPGSNAMVQKMESLFFYIVLLAKFCASLSPNEAEPRASQNTSFSALASFTENDQNGHKYENKQMSNM